jgi:hypothetical protein
MEVDSHEDRYTPGPGCPAGFNLGIPPANKPPSWGAPAPAPAIAAAEDVLPPAREAPEPPLPVGFTSMMGALRSLVSAFLSLFPAWICSKSALDAMVQDKILCGGTAMLRSQKRYVSL